MSAETTMEATAQAPASPVSQRKRAANRANARKSTGPRTAAGKARVSLNALTHGLTARGAVLPFENPDHFEKFAAALRQDLRPAGFLQTLIAERIVDLAWKLRRTSVAQTNLAAHLLDEDLHAHQVAVMEGAYSGPYEGLSGADVVTDSAAAAETSENATYLRLELYADRLQRAMLAALARLRREQDRDAAGKNPAPAATDVEVELGDDAAENSAVPNKATAEGEPAEEQVDLRSYCSEPWAKMRERAEAKAAEANSQNKATGDAPGGGGEADSPLDKWREELAARCETRNPKPETRINDEARITNDEGAGAGSAAPRHPEGSGSDPRDLGRGPRVDAPVDPSVN